MTELKQLLQEIRELKAMVAQLGPVEVRPTIEQEIAAVEAQGLDVFQYFKEKGATYRPRKKKGARS